MIRTPISSSFIASAGFNDGAMEIEFANGDVHLYEGIDEHTFDQMMQAKSVGQYFHKNIKNKFSSVVVSEGKKIGWGQ